MPAVAEVLAKSGVEAARARTLLQILLREKRLVAHQRRPGLSSFRDREAARRCWPRKSRQRFNVADFKEWTGISRKYAIPLLEFLDREHVTRREGDERLVL